MVGKMHPAQKVDARRNSLYENLLRMEGETEPIGEEVADDGNNALKPLSPV